MENKVVGEDVIIVQQPDNLVKDSSIDSTANLTNGNSNNNTITNNDQIQNNEETPANICKDVLEYNDKSGEGIINDIVHTLNDAYVYSRIVIENNYFNFSDNTDFNIIYPNLYVSNYSTSTNLELLQKLLK